MTTSDHDERLAGWSHHPRANVLRPVDLVTDLPVPGSAWPLSLQLVYTPDSLYVPAVERKPAAPRPLPTIHAPIPDTRIDIARARMRIAEMPGDLHMLVVGRDEDHLQGPFMKLHELLVAVGKRAEWASFSHPEHAYQPGPRRSPDGCRPDPAQQATLEPVPAFLDAHVRDRR